MLKKNQSLTFEANLCWTNAVKLFFHAFEVPLNEYYVTFSRCLSLLPLGQNTKDFQYFILENFLEKRKAGYSKVQCSNVSMTHNSGK